MDFPTTQSQPHFDNTRLAALMRQVLYALTPAILLMMWYFGWGIISNLLLATLFSVFFESLALWLRKRPLKPFLSDYSVTVTAFLLALTLPPFASWSLIFVATFFAVIVAKQIYGGLGYNPFNPAMIGYAVVLISFPIEMVSWTTPIDNSFSTISFMDAFNRIFALQSTTNWDALTSATVLDSLKTNLHMGQTLSTLTQKQNNFGFFAGTGWEWISLAYLLGGLWLLYKKVITWHIPVALLSAVIILSTPFWLFDSEHYASPFFHLFAGGTMLGAFFIATDPISASTTPLGKLIYAACVGIFLYIIRVWGSAYPDGVAFAVIIMNMAVPMIDTYTQPRVFGHHNSPNNR